MGNGYDDLARFYDALFADRQDDLPFWREEFADSGHACEVGCGTGRVLRAVSGSHLVGIDPSPAMLLEAANQGTEAKLRTGGFPSLPANDGEFDLVACPRGALSHVLDLGEQIRSVRELYRVLMPGGRVIVDVPYLGLGHRLFTLQPRFRRVHSAIIDGSRFTYFQKFEFDSGSRVLSTSYRVFHGRRARNLIAEERIATFLYTPSEISLLLLGAGFGDVQVWGGYQREELSNTSSRIVASARAEI